MAAYSAGKAGRDAVRSYGSQSKLPGSRRWRVEVPISLPTYLCGWGWGGEREEFKPPLLSLPISLPKYLCGWGRGEDPWVGHLGALFFPRLGWS